MSDKQKTNENTPETPGIPASAQVEPSGEGHRIKTDDHIRKLSDFIELNPNPVIELQEGGSISYFNKAADRLADSFRMDAVEGILPKNRNVIVKRCLLLHDSERHVDMECDGRTVSWSFYPFSETRSVYCYGSEITEKLRLEKKLAQAQKMEAVGSLAGGIAHDFNNLLTAIKGYADLALNRTEENTELYRELQEIRKASSRAAKLTRQLLVFSKSKEVKLEPMIINDSVRGLLKMLERLIGEDIVIEIELSQDLWPVKADENNIEQIIMNLAVNARDAMPSGGTIKIRTSNAVIDTEMSRSINGAAEGKYVCLSVKDTGTGISDKNLDHVFEPFFTTKGKEGTGLGLAMVYGIVQQHKGWINIRTEQGTGTLFLIYLPAISSDSYRKHKESDAQIGIRGHGERILLVEDEESVREFASRALIETGYKVFAAECIADALEIFRREKGNFELVFSDVILPDGSGPDMVNEMMEERPGLNVLFGSGYAGTKSRFFYISQEGFSYLQKPYDLNEMLQTIRHVIQDT